MNNTLKALGLILTALFIYTIHKSRVNKYVEQAYNWGVIDGFNGGK